MLRNYKRVLSELIFMLNDTKFNKNRHTFHSLSNKCITISESVLPLI